MKRLQEVLKSFRKIEALIIIAAVCTLLVLGWGEGGEEGSALDGDEQRLKQILTEINGAGRVSVMISRDPHEDLLGVVVTASGAGEIRVMLEIQRAVKTLTGLELDQIEVLESKR